MLYLASRSPRRYQLLRRLHRPFKVVASTHRETIRRRSTPSANAMRNAAGKALQAVLPKNARGIVIGADTFLWFGGRAIGKPKTWVQARKVIARLSGKSHWVYTGLCLRDTTSGAMRCTFARSKVVFRKLASRAIAKYVARVHALDKAGGYAVQEDNGELIKAIQGSRTNVMGLPVELLQRELKVFKKRHC